MFDPAFVEAITKLGTLGFAVIAIGALYLRKIRTEGEFKDREAQWQERFEELREDRDEWRTLATSSGPRLERLTDVVELLTGKPQ